MKRLFPPLFLSSISLLVGCSDTTVEAGDTPSSRKNNENLKPEASEPLAAGHGQIRLVEESEDGPIRRARWKVDFGPNTGVLAYKEELRHTGGRGAGSSTASSFPQEELGAMEILYEEEKITGKEVLNLIDVLGQKRNLSEAILEKDQGFKKATAYHVKMSFVFAGKPRTSSSYYMAGPANGTWNHAASGFGYGTGEPATFRLGEGLRLAYRLWSDGPRLTSSGTGPNSKVEVDGKMIDIKDYPGQAWLCWITFGAKK
jgi:hypothetical protein